MSLHKQEAKPHPSYMFTLGSGMAKWIGRAKTDSSVEVKIVQQVKQSCVQNQKE